MSRNPNYGGRVSVNSGLIPANKQEFPLMDAHDVLAGENNLRLDEKLESIDKTLGGFTETGAIKIEDTVYGTSETTAPSQKAVHDALNAKVSDSLTQASTNVAPSQRAVLEALTSSAYNATSQLPGHMSPEDKTKLDTFDFKTYSSDQKSPPGLYVASVYLNVSGIAQKYYFSSFYRAQYETVLIDTFIGGNFIQLTVYSDGTSAITDSDGLPISAFTSLKLLHIGG
jgi:hypothetical protein